MKNALILKNESLNKYNSWRVGGTADALFSPKNLEDLYQQHKKFMSYLSNKGLINKNTKNIDKFIKTFSLIEEPNRNINNPIYFINYENQKNE